MRFGSLFAGIGGMDLGLERAGMKCIWQVEIDDYCNKVLAKHWPDVKRYRDVRLLDARELERVDLIAGGFPCQDISIAGAKAGIQGKRSGLWSEYTRLVRSLRPRYVLVENVAALLDRGMGRVLGDLSALGYDAEWETLPASVFGAPHLRDRVYLLAYSASNGWKKSDQYLRFVSEDVKRNPGTWNGRRVAEPGIQRVVDGIPYFVDRLKGCGNAVVPQVAEWIGRRIMEAAE